MADTKKKKEKGFAKEFREFALRGNVIDLAVGVIIGGAFQGIINTFVRDLIMPLIGAVTGGVDFTNKFVILGKVPAGANVSTLDAARAVGPVFAYGSFITAVINFIIMAFIIFLMVKAINKVRNLGAANEEIAPAEKKCDFCRKAIAYDAVKCPYCTSDLK